MVRPLISRKTQLVSLGMIVALLTACTPTLSNPTPSPTPAIGDGGFLSGSPCAAPCFWNITPGEITETQATEILNADGSKDIFGLCEPFDNEAEGGGRSIICTSVILNFQENSSIVSSLGFKSTQPILVEDVIRKYGDPNLVLVTTSGTPEEEHHITMMLFFDSIYTDLVLEEQSGGTYTVFNSTAIKNIGYSSKDEYDNEKAKLTDFIQSWRGYGEYRVRSP